MATSSSSTPIDEIALTKGQRRKLHALRKSVGDKIGEQAFAAWLSSQSAARANRDENAALIVDTLWASRPGRNAGDPARRLRPPARSRSYHRRARAVLARIIHVGSEFGVADVA